jgi:hypothetical protein
MGVKGYWGAGVFVLVLAVIVVGAILMPTAPADKKSNLPSSAEELVAAAKTLSVGSPESTIVAAMGEPKAKNELLPGLVNWGYGDVSISVYKGKIQGMEGCNFMTRGEMIPPELQTPQYLKPKPLAVEGQSPAESAAKSQDQASP